MTSPTYSTDPNTGIAFDYGPELTSIAASLATIAANSTVDSATLTTISSTLTSVNSTLSSISSTLSLIKADLDNMSANSTTMANLAQGSGMHTIGPYDWVGLAEMYKSTVEQASILNTEDVVDSTTQAKALQELTRYLSKIGQLPKSF